MMSCGSNDAEKFVGTWTGDITCPGEEPQNISVVIALGAEDGDLILTVDNTPPSVNATADGDNITLETTRDDEGDGDYTDISGSGSLNGDGNLILTFDIKGYEDGVLVGEGSCTGTLSM